MSIQPSILAAGACDPLPRWGRRLAEGHRLISAPPEATPESLREVALRSGVDWMVVELRSATGPCRPGRDLDRNVEGLLRSAPCPVLSVQPWVRAPSAARGVAIVGVDPSPAARAAARAAARLLRLLAPSGRLVLAHGSRMHPADLAPGPAWSSLRDRMRPGAQPWIHELASELDAPMLSIDIAVQPIWTPDLLRGLAQRMDADFTALGLSPSVEAPPPRAPPLWERVVLGTPCPLLTVAPLTEAATHPLDPVAEHDPVTNGAGGLGEAVGFL